MSDRYEVMPVGWVKSPLLEPAQAPRQGDEGAPSAWLVFEPSVAEAAGDLRAGEHIIVVSWLDRASRDVLTTHHGTTRTVRCWASSAPARPTDPTRSVFTVSRSSPSMACGFL